MCCSQQQITGRYAVPENGSPKYQHEKACWGNACMKWGARSNNFTVISNVGTIRNF